jgi:outer membrane protein assembly factor BamA
MQKLSKYFYEFIQLKYFCFLFIFSFIPEFARDRVANIYIINKDIFDTLETNNFFASELINTLHIKTKKYVIEDELLFKNDDELSMQLLDETERNLRKLGIFSKVDIEIDSSGYDSYDIYVNTQDRWSTYPMLIFGSGGGTLTYGGKLKELNLLGTNTKIDLSCYYRTENKIGLQGSFELNQSRIFRSDYSISVFLLSHIYRTDQAVSIYNPYRTLSDDYSYGVDLYRSFGSEFYYRQSDTTKLLPFKENLLSGWFSKAWMVKDRIFFTLMTQYHDVERNNEKFRRAFDNSGRILLSFSSIDQEFIEMDKINSYYVEDMIVGGWGSAILGKIFPIGPSGEGLYYIAGQGELSRYDGRLYLFGHIAAGSGFKGSSSKYTYQEFLGNAFYRFNKNLLLCTRIVQQTVWNWNALRQLILDYNTGLRGYDANMFSGDNRIISNIELRFFPDIEFWIIKFSGALFYDIGTVWNQNIKLHQSKFHSSFGFGLRLHDSRSAGVNSIFRIDVAFNLDERRLGTIILASDQLFSAFVNHIYKLPTMLGSGFDVE